MFKGFIHCNSLISAKSSIIQAFSSRLLNCSFLFPDLLGRALVFEQEVPQTGETVEVERYRPGTGFEVGLNLRF